MCPAVNHVNKAAANVLARTEISDIQMFGAVIEKGVVNSKDCALIITHDRHWVVHLDSDLVK